MEENTEKQARPIELATMLETHGYKVESCGYADQIQLIRSSTPKRYIVLQVRQ